MIRRLALRSCVLAVAGTSLGAQRTTPATQVSNGKKPVPVADWAKWETLGQGSLSPDGKWVAWDLRRQVGGVELRYRAVGDDADKIVRLGSNPLFTKTSRFLLYTITPDTTNNGGRGGARGGGAGRGGATGVAGNAAAARNSVGIVDLRSGTTILLAEVQSFALSGSGTHVALRRYPAQGRRGADVVVRDLEQGSEVTFGNIAEFGWSDEGALLAMAIDVEGKTGNGVQLLNAETGAIRSLDASDLNYANLTWRARSDDIMVLRSRIDTAFVDTSYAVLAWKHAGATSPAKQLYDFSTDNAFPAGMRIASYRRPQWSDDGGTVFLGIGMREPKSPPAPRGGVAPARVEIWHWKDLREYHQQDRQSAQDRTKTHLAAWHLTTNKVVRLADDQLETVQLSDNRKVGIATDASPYVKEEMSGRSYRDVYKVDVTTGKRDKILTKTGLPASLSPDGTYLLYQQGTNWWTLNLASGARANVTQSAKSVFVNMEDDHPTPERRAYGAAGLSKGESSVFLYDRFDVWQVNADGTSPVRLTRGREDSTVYRVVRETGGTGGGRGGGRGGFGGGVDTDPQERFIDTEKPLLLSATGEFTRKSGYARVTPGQPVQRLLYVDKGVSRLEKAKEADVYLFEQQSYADSPNFFVSGGTFANARRVSNTNAMQSDFAWGKQQLLPYRNSRGDKLQMMLTYPADYVPGKKYPMVVYYYEKLSNTFQNYVNPSERATYNTQNFSQNGYFVLRPDIVFQPRNPGLSGLDCVTAAVKAAIAVEPSIDPAKVGNMGHSWGGYQSAFYAANQPKGLFAATIAGAPLTNLISFYGYTSFNTGSPETGHFETGQERMEVSLWEDPQAYLRNSTVMQMDKLQTPLLLEEGDADGNVNPWQSHELYNAGRRLGKNVVYLLYNDENHGVARPESQADYTRRQLEWFGHYLKGEPAADWILNGETYLARQKLLKEGGATPGSVVP